jgi:hypothetical protein
MADYDEYERIRQGIIMASLEALFLNSSEETEGNQKRT